ncbi:aldehyde dehydrogenase (NADP(+)) [Dokdonia sp. Asnod2-E02]|uniref:aldehyde dehydrogenase (NADP(+)) n=1 Tax=Dokdonia sp. Asnod2-E02 TaxID=3160574 RepID=UPI00386F0CF9
MITGKNQIGYKQSAEGAKTYKTANPVTNSDNPTVFYEATQLEIDEACSLAAHAFSTYSKLPGVKRASFLNAIADEIEALGSDLITMYLQESGLPEGRAQGERGRTLGQLRMFAELVKKDTWRLPLLQDEDGNLKKTYIPLGPVVVFGASNFPLAFSTAGGDTASALAAGCPVIVKSHPMHAGTGEMVATAITKAAQKTGMPEGVFFNLNSSGKEVGEQLVKHKGIAAVGFTGSHHAGRALYNLAAARETPIPVFAEMGSINPVVITQQAISKRAAQIAETYAASITQGVGQFCTNPGLIITVKSEETTHFIEILAKHLEAAPDGCMLHTRIQEGYEKSKNEIKEQEGVSLKVVGSSSKPNHTTAVLAVVDGTSFIANKTLHKEVFGPFSMVVLAEDENELLKIINSLEGQLTATIIAEDNETTALQDITLALQNKVGRIIYNGVPTGVAVVDGMTHGGPYPASTDSRFTAVGNHSIMRWVRPFSFQDFPTALLPDYLK